MNTRELYWHAPIRGPEIEPKQTQQNLDPQQKQMEDPNKREPIQNEKQTKRKNPRNKQLPKTDHSSNPATALQLCSNWSKEYPLKCRIRSIQEATLNFSISTKESAAASLIHHYSYRRKEPKIKQADNEYPNLCEMIQILQNSWVEAHFRFLFLVVHSIHHRVRSPSQETTLHWGVRSAQELDCLYWIWI